MGNYKTYYLGAGASANAIPIIQNFSLKFGAFVNLMIDWNRSVPSGAVFDYNMEKKLIQLVKDLRTSFSPDTIVKKNYHRGNEDNVDFIKRILTGYFIFEQRNDFQSSKLFPNLIEELIDLEKEYKLWIEKNEGGLKQLNEILDMMRFLLQLLRIRLKKLFQKFWTISDLLVGIMILK